MMIAASVKDSEKLVELLLQRGADVNQTSKPALMVHAGGQPSETDLGNFR